MDLRPDLPRLRYLELSGYKPGEQVLFCPTCPWQLHSPAAMKPECPVCGSALHLIRVDEELLNLSKEILP